MPRGATLLPATPRGAAARCSVRGPGSLATVLPSGNGGPPAWLLRDHARSFGPGLPGSSRPAAPSRSPGISRVHSPSSPRRRLSPARLSVARFRRVLVPVIDTYEYGYPSGVAQPRAPV